jgi:hypothetical protein
MWISHGRDSVEESGVTYVEVDEQATDDGDGSEEDLEAVKPNLGELVEHGTYECTELAGGDEW